MPEFEASSLFLSLVTSSVGLALFVYGKKQQRLPQLVTGLAFMVYPYFISSVGATLIVAALLGGACWAAVWYGY